MKQAGSLNILDFRKDFFKFAKRSNPITSISAKEIELVSEDGSLIGFMRAINELMTSDEKTISNLARWRDQHQYAYPTHFKVTTEGTKQWLKSGVVENPLRLLFLIEDLHRHGIGHIGLVIRDDGELEIDNVLRGEETNPGLMGRALAQLEELSYDELGADRLVLRVLASNVHAVNFYLRHGYREEARENLAKEKTNDGWTLVPSISQVDDVFVLMAKNISSSRRSPDRILTAGPSVGLREMAYTADAAKNGWNNHHSDYLMQFESQFAEFVGAKYAMATSSCTGALHLALLALGIGAGDEVLVPETTWVATASAVTYVGATPVFVDIDAETWCMSVSDMEQKITKRSRAIIPVHLYGYAADMTPIMDLARSRNLFVVEDAAPAIGTLVSGKPAGSFGDFGCFSFQGAKMLVTGEGGMLVSSDDDLMKRARKIQDHGRKPGTFWIEEVGYKYKMSNLTAAFGLAQLERAELQILRKRRIFSQYASLLSGYEGLQFQLERANSRSICWMTSVSLGESIGSTREQVMAELNSNGIDTRPVFPPISTYGIWRTNSKPGETATRIGDRAINLPSGVRMSEKSVERVCETLIRTCGVK
jgi:perosamine synthetase